MAAQVECSHHPLRLEVLDDLPPLEALVVFIAENERPLVGAAGFLDWRMSGRLSRLLKSAFFTGAAEDQLLVTTEGALPIPRVFAVGMGRTGILQRERVDALLERAAEILNRAGIREVALELPPGAALEPEVRRSALEQGFLKTFKGQRVAVLEPAGADAI